MRSKGLIAVGLAIGVLVPLLGCSPPPQLPADRCYRGLELSFWTYTSSPDFKMVGPWNTKDNIDTYEISNDDRDEPCLGVPLGLETWVFVFGLTEEMLYWNGDQLCRNIDSSFQGVQRFPALGLGADARWDLGLSTGEVVMRCV